MEMTNVWEQFEALTPAEKRQVADFIVFLSSRRRRQPMVDAASPKALADEAFVGIWADREELADSTEWLRRLRSEEWGQ
jgi:hypothetical protein